MANFPTEASSTPAFFLCVHVWERWELGAWFLQGWSESLNVVQPQQELFGLLSEATLQQWKQSPVDKGKHEANDFLQPEYIDFFFPPSSAVHFSKRE